MCNPLHHHVREGRWRTVQPQPQRLFESATLSIDCLGIDYAAQHDDTRCLLNRVVVVNAACAQLVELGLRLIYKLGHAVRLAVNRPTIRPQRNSRTRTAPTSICAGYYIWTRPVRARFNVATSPFAGRAHAHV
jgi:hypothetical protein